MIDINRKGANMKISIMHIMIIAAILIAFIPCTAQAKIVTISSGLTVVQALDDKGYVWVWGDGTTPDKAWQLPIDKVTAIASGGMCSYLLKNDGTVWAWGDGSYGGLGNKEIGINNTPVQVTGLTEVIAIASSGRNGYALKNDGTVWAWGANYDGELGIGTKSIPKYTTTPVQIVGLNDVVALGDHGCYAVKKDGSVYAWGNNTFTYNPDTGYISYGALGDASRQGVQTPFRVPDVCNVKQISSSGNPFTVYLKNDGTVWAWGANLDGEMGDGTQTQTYLNGTWIESECVLPPVQAKITEVKQIAVAMGAMTTVNALKNDGTVWEWGGTVRGPVKLQGYSSALLPIQVTGLDHIIQISQELALRDDGTVWGWGQNFGKKLKDGAESTSVKSPIMIFKEPEQPATPTPTPTPTPSVTVTVTAATPTVAPSDTLAPVQTPTPVPSGTPQQASTPAVPIDGLIVEIAGIIGLMLAAVVIIYIWLTKRL